MSLSDLKNKLAQRLFRGEKDGNRRPDGGTSCYRPIRRKSQAETSSQEEPPLTYIHTGFTGMNPPANGFDTGFGMENFGQGAYGQQPAYAQPGPVQNTAYSRQGSQTGPAYGTGLGRVHAEEAATAAVRPERGWFPAREEAAPRSNISYMPGYTPEAGAAPFNHVEHILTMTGLKSCYEAIECMKNGETLIVELAAIANENESMRCQDMLAGAAFTLGCSVRILQGARLVLIAPEGVKILPEENTARPEMIPPVYAAPAVQEFIPQPRERRSGRNAADWNAARNGQMETYNPYTGTMPVAAGAYGSFGGYGY